RIREVEAFIERGYRENDYFSLNFLLMWNWIRKNEPFGKVTDSAIADSTQKRIDSIQKKFDAQLGGVRAAVERYVSFLKQCETRIDALPTGFAGLGDDPLLREFMKDERQGGWIQ